MRIFKVKMIRKSGKIENFEVTSFSTATKALEYFKKLADFGEKEIIKATVANGFDADTVDDKTNNIHYPSHRHIKSPKLDNESLELRLEFEDIDGGLADWLTPPLLKDVINEEKKEKSENQTVFWPSEGCGNGRVG